MDRRLKIALSELTAASQNKGMFESLCFAVLVKSTFVNSRIYPHSIRESKEIFHIGQDRLKRVIQGCLRYGYATAEGDVIVFRSLTHKKARNVIIETQTSFKGVERLLREQLILSKIRQVEFMENKVSKAFAENRMVSRRDIRIIRRYNMNSERDSFSGTISKRTLADVAKCSISTATSLIKDLKAKGEIRVKRNIEKLPSKVDISFMSLYNADENPFHIHRNQSGFYLSLPNTYCTIF